MDKLLLAIAFVLTAAAIVTGSYVYDKETVQVGQVSPKRYVAERDIVDTVATERLRQEARDSVGSLYKQDDGVKEATFESIRWFFSDMDDFLLSMTDEEGNTVKSYRDAVFQIPVMPTNRQFDIYNSLSAVGRQNFLTDVLGVAEKVLDQGVTDETRDKSLALAYEGIEATTWNPDLKTLGYSVVEATLSPNLVLDEAAMESLREQRAAEVQPVMIYKNQKLVDEGEIITQDVYDLLTELNLVNQDYSDSIVPFMGSLALTLMLFAAAVLYFRSSRKKMKPNEVLMLFTSYALMVVILRVTATLETYVLIPLALFSMLVSILLDSRKAVVLNAVVSVVGTFIFNGSMSFLLYFLVTGTIAALLMPYTEKRNRILVICLVMGLVNFICYWAIGVFVQGGSSPQLLKEAALTIITGALTVMVAVGSLPLWEAAFEANTPIKLLELVNPNNELLRRLMIEAPGTYHHSLIVANLAETAAYEIGANTTLARVGAYYHDIGKLKFPLYFGENQGAENPHDNLMPDVSARMLREHTRFGRELAEAYRLPRTVADIVVQHHGTTLIKYFYVEACKRFGAENVNEADYRYDGPIPQSREAALVMLADTIEAATRSNVKAGKSAEEIGNMMKVLIKDKLDDGQLNDSGLAIHDLETIRRAFLQVFHGMYHDRVQYPKEEEVKALQGEAKAK